MANAIELVVGHSPWSLTVPEDRQVKLHRAPVAPLAGSQAELMRAALENPYHFEPLRRALTPDDRVAIVLDADLPHVAVLLGEVLAHLGSAGIQPEAVTIITAPGAPQAWVEELSDEYADVRTETHDSIERTKLSYLATTTAGRRLYLNRTLVDADFAIVLTGRGYDPATGYAGAEVAIFPALSDEDTRESFAGQFSVKAASTEAKAIRDEAKEVVRLFGLPFFVQVIAGEGDAVQEVVAGLPESCAEGILRQDARWHAIASEEADTAIAAISGDPGRVTFLDIAKAAACAARVLKKGGRIAVLTTAAPDLGMGARLLRSMDGPVGAKRLLAKEKPNDWIACRLWAFAAKRCSLFVASAYPDDVVEELFATPIRTSSEVQRLIGTEGKVLVIPDAHRTMVTQ